MPNFNFNVSVVHIGENDNVIPSKKKVIKKNGRFIEVPIINSIKENEESDYKKPGDFSALIVGSILGWLLAMAMGLSGCFG